MSATNPENPVELELEKLMGRLRKAGLDSLCLMEYEKYLKTNLWKEIKSRVLARDGNQCVICHRTSSRWSRYTDSDYLYVHHRSYDSEVLEGRRDEHLVTLCNRCHSAVEYLPDGKQRGMAEKDEEYFRLRALHEDIESNGLPLFITKKTNGRTAQLELGYIGKKEHEFFYSFELFLYGLTLDFFNEHRPKIRIPLPFGTDKFAQKTGARLIDRATNKEVMRVNLQTSIATFKIKSEYFDVVCESLPRLILKQKHWRLAESEYENH